MLTVTADCNTLSSRTKVLWSSKFLLLTQLPNHEYGSIADADQAHAYLALQPRMICWFDLLI